MLSCQYARLLISLTAAAVAFFSLERKETKVQERGDASVRRPYSRPAPSFEKAFALFRWFFFFVIAGDEVISVCLTGNKAVI